MSEIQLCTGLIQWGYAIKNPPFFICGFLREDGGGAMGLRSDNWEHVQAWLNGHLHEDQYVTVTYTYSESYRMGYLQSIELGREDPADS